jgi:hypothetical protein
MLAAAQQPGRRQPGLSKPPPPLSGVLPKEWVQGALSTLDLSNNAFVGERPSIAACQMRASLGPPPFPANDMPRHTACSATRPHPILQAPCLPAWLPSPA